MKTKDAMKILGCSRATVHNWLKQGHLRLARTLPNGYREIDDASVYEAAGRVYGPSGRENMVIVFKKDGTREIFAPADAVLEKIIEFLSATSQERPQG